MLIRMASTSDAAEITNVHLNTWREAYRGLIAQSYLDERPLYFKERLKLWEEITAEKGQSIYVAEHESYGIVGFINGGPARDRSLNNFSEVYCLYLFEKFHHQKIGLRLLQAFFRDSLEKGFQQSYLWVLKENPTIRFYEKTGAVFTGDIQKDVIAGEELEEVRYEWTRVRNLLDN